MNSLSPVLAVKNYLYGFEGKTVDGPSTVIVIRPPQHGKLIDEGTIVIDGNTGVKTDSGEGERNYTYVPDDNFVGKDSTTLLVEIDGYKVTLVSVFEVAKEINENDVGPGGTICPKSYWKISLTQDNVDPSAVAFGLPDALSNQLLKNINVSLNIASLPDGKLGETTGTSITLDDNGGGYGWFIDSTPQDNSEFLPTSDPNKWEAKPGSDAAGKMDLLTVLLHEYGHALGLDHSADTHDFMAADLQPGVRRTISDADMTKLWSLLSEPLGSDGSALTLALSPGAGEGTRSGDP